MIWLNHLDEITFCIPVVVLPVAFTVSHFAFSTVIHRSAMDRWVRAPGSRLAALCGVSPDERGDRGLEANIMPIYRRSRLRGAPRHRTIKTHVCHLFRKSLRPLPRLCCQSSTKSPRRLRRYRQMAISALSQRTIIATQRRG